MSSNDVRHGTCPFGFDEVVPSRRSLLLGAGLASGAALLTRGAAAQGSTQPSTHDHAISAESLVADHSHDGGAHDFDNDGTREAQPFYGPHQSGVVNPQPAAAVIAAFDVLATNRADLQRLLELLSTRIPQLMKGGEVQITNPQMPPPDNLVLGPDVFPDNLTITVALGASLFDDRFGLAGQRPKHLVRMEQFENDALETSFCHGDILLQFCANTAETNIHALREVLRATPDLLAIRWKMDGFLPPHTLKKLGKDTIRNLLGFKDGTANIDAADADLMNELVWVGAAHEEPAWAHDGSYIAVRLIRMLVERWDRTPLGEQQEIIGRQKASGAPLGMAQEHDLPNYASPDNKIPTDAHIRLANPRTPATQANLMLRRPYNYSRDAVTKAGQLDMGLAFICFQADLDAAFAPCRRGSTASHWKSTSSRSAADISSCCRVRRTRPTISAKA